MEGHRHGEPETEASTDGPSEGPAEGHAPGTGRSFLPWALESGASSGLETVLSAALSGVEEFRFSRKSCAARVQVARGRTQRRQRLSQSGPCPAVSGGRGAMQTSRWASWSCDHCHLTTAGVCPCFFFFFGEGEGDERAVPFFYVGRMCQVQVQSDLVERGLQQNTHASRWLHTVLV